MKGSPRKRTKRNFGASRFALHNFALLEIEAKRGVCAIFGRCQNYGMSRRWHVLSFKPPDFPVTQGCALTILTEIHRNSKNLPLKGMVPLSADISWTFAFIV